MNPSYRRSRFTLASALAAVVLVGLSSLPAAAVDLACDGPVTTIGVHQPAPRVVVQLGAYPVWLLCSLETPPAGAGLTVPACKAALATLMEAHAPCRNVRITIDGATAPSCESQSAWNSEPPTVRMVQVLP